jgi:hypothetical protein
VQIHSYKGYSPLQNALWTDEKNSFFVESIKEAMLTKMHFHDFSRNDFLLWFQTTPNYGKKCIHFEKYKIPAREEKLTPSTLEICNPVAPNMKDHRNICPGSSIYIYEFLIWPLYGKTCYGCDLL